MPIDNATGLGAGIANTSHELDEAVIAAVKKRMVGKAEPLLAAIFAAKTAAERNIAKRQTFVDGSATMAQAVRDAYDNGDEKALGTVEKDLETYKKSLLRTKSSSRR